MNENDIVGTVNFRFSDIEAGKYADYFWANIYGAPLGVHGAHTDKMNSEPRYASYWRGRILIRIQMAEAKKPKTKVEKVKEEGFQERISTEFESGNEWEIRC
jgi:hypothetical protein